MFNIFKKASFTLALLLVVTLYLPGNVSANSASQPAHIQAEMSISNAPSEWQNYIDSEYGFQVGYPAYGWTAEIAFQNETQEDDVIRKRSLRS